MALASYLILVLLCGYFGILCSSSTCIITHVVMAREVQTKNFQNFRIFQKKISLNLCLKSLKSGTVNLFLFGGMICLCVLWITQNNVYTKIWFKTPSFPVWASGLNFRFYTNPLPVKLNRLKLLETDFYGDMFEGSADDDYRPNCKPTKTSFILNGWK